VFLQLSCNTHIFSYFLRALFFLILQLYKGKLENGTVIAIRCLALHQRYSIRNLKLRLDLLSKLRHPNLVCLLGHCIDSAVDESSVKRVFLVYEYVPSGTLSSYLSGMELHLNMGNQVI
jgi:hypothetical protein